jgi:tetratricopeptide (TPR) repeat protein
MRLWSWLLVAALAAVPAVADEKKKKDDKKAKEAPAQAVVQDAVQEAEAKLAAGDAEGAVEVLQKGSTAAGEPGGRAALRLGQVRETRGELDLAVDAYKVAGEKLAAAGKGEALGRMAVVQDTRDMSAAAASAEAAAAADSEGLWPTIALSYRRAHEGKADEAIALAQKALAAGGGAAATAALAHAQEAKGDMTAAEASYREAIGKDATALGPMIGLASVLRKTGRAAEAEPLLKKVLDAAPGAVEAYKEQARVKMALGRAQDALADANLAAAMAENDTEAQALVLEVRVARALQSIGEGQADLAVQDLTQIRDQNPDKASVRLGLGRAQIARRDSTAALAELQKAVELDPNLAEAHYQMGYVQHLMKGNVAAAIASYEKAVAAEPGNLMYRASLGAALAAAQQSDRAIAELTKVTGDASYTRPEAWISLGQAYVGAKKYKEAVPVLEKATSLAPNSDQAWAFLAWAYFGLKDANNFKAAGGKARTLGHKEPTLLAYLKRVEGGEAIK